MATGTGKRPGRAVRAVVKLLDRMGYRYVLLPFSAPRTCNICGFEGTFLPSGVHSVRPDVICPSCRSKGRHRLFALFLERSGWSAEGKDVLHFAPERTIAPLLRQGARRYVGADLMDPKADVAWNIEAIDSGDESFDVVSCSHVLEHVDTPKALGEIRRVLRPGGTAFLMIPIVEGLDVTYTNPAVRTDHERQLHFHQADHVRLIGRDFRDQVRAAGFDLTEFAASGEEAARHSISVGERVFIATRR